MVFLSYDREDRSVARKVATALQHVGHDVWWDRNIRGGAEFSEEIDRALAASEAVVVLWSARSIASAWVRDEAATGRDSGRLVPVRIDDCAPPLGFRQYQTIDLPPGRKSTATIDAIDEAVRALGSGAAGPDRARASQQADSAATTRRSLLVGAGAAAAIAAGGAGTYWYRQSRRDEVPPEVAPLLIQAKQLMNQNTREGQYQAIGLYKRVVQMAPNFADGWGWLGYACGVVSHYRERAEGLAMRARAESAGRHALELDPDSAMGEIALAVALPFVGTWAERERRLARAISLAPDEDQGSVMMAVALQFAGRSTESLSFYERITHKPLTPAEYTNFIRALWSAGRLPELDRAVKDAGSLYPSQASIWFTRLQIATYGPDVGAVEALADDRAARPTGVDDEAVADALRVVRAVRRRDPAEADAIMNKETAGARRTAQLADSSIRTASALGRLDDAFMLTNAYYFGRPFVIPDYAAKGSSFSPEQRQTRFLFEPVTKPMRADPRFEPLVKALGFDRYWHESRKPPDYRHIPGL
jgi:tetratricopeptide (TPR) repeat protein